MYVCIYIYKVQTHTLTSRNADRENGRIRHTHIHTYIHTYIYIHTHTYTKYRHIPSHHATQIEKIVIFGLGKAFAWGLTQYYISNKPVSSNCVQEESEIGVVRVWIGTVGCGKHHSVMNSLALKWKSMAGSQSKYMAVSESLVS